MELAFREKTEQLIRRIRHCPTAYQTVAEMRAELEKEGYRYLDVSKEEKPQSGGKYYSVLGGTSLLAFRLPTDGAHSFMITAAHSDSPTFKLKENAESVAFGTYLRLNTERYGGMILSSWFDRPLSVAGRVLVRHDKQILSVPVTVDRDLCLIPNVAIHMNRKINDGWVINPAVDCFPLLGEASESGALRKVIAKAANVDEHSIVGTDLFLYDRTPGTIFGSGDAFFASPRIDNLQCAFSCFDGFLASKENGTVPVYAVFDNEETGSSTKQGADSMFLRDTLEAIAEALGHSLPAMLTSSVMISADNGHARHPNHPELSCADNAPQLNGGVVIKSNAAQHYTTDGESSALLRCILDDAAVPYQYFANRSDMPGGSTLGSISNTKVPLTTVDIGAAQLAMHSAYETAGCRDTAYLEAAAAAFYGRRLTRTGNGFTFEV